MNFTKQLLAYTLLLLLVVGCASKVSRTNMPTVTGPAWSQQIPLGNLELVMTESGKNSIRDNLKFDPKILKDHVKRALSANSLLVEDLGGRLPQILVEIKDVRVRSNFSAVMWGVMAGNDHITGDIVIQNNNGSELDRFEVSVSYALGGLAGGMDSARMGWLYETFAEETVKELAKNSPQPIVYTAPKSEPLSKYKAKENELEVASPVPAGSRTNDNDDINFNVGDLAFLEFVDGETKVITITEINDDFVAGYYDYEDGKYQIPDEWDRSNIVSIKRARAIQNTRISEPTQPKPEDIFKNGDVIILEFNNGNTREIILTHMNDRLIAGHIQYDRGHTTPVNYDRRNVRRVSYANKEPNKIYDLDNY